MRAYSFVFLLVIGSFFSTNISLASAEQKIVFCVESIKYKSVTGSETCQIFCNSKYGQYEIDSFLSDGWRIVSSSPKEAIPSDVFDCICVGTQYVLQKDEPIPDVPNKEVELLKKENDLLKRENDLLKQENENLKVKLKTKQKKK
jgi:hypothetical protein